MDEGETLVDKGVTADVGVTMAEAGTEINVVASSVTVESDSESYGKSTTTSASSSITLSSCSRE